MRRERAERAVRGEEEERSMRKLESLRDSNLIFGGLDWEEKDWVILLIFPFFLPEMKSRCSFDNSSWKLTWW